MHKWWYNNSFIFAYKDNGIFVDIRCEKENQYGYREEGILPLPFSLGKSQDDSFFRDKNVTLPTEGGLILHIIIPYETTIF